MRKFILPIVLIASLGASSMAMAATMTATTTSGLLKTINAKTCVVTLAKNKAVFHLAPKCDLSAFKVGEKVAVTWTLKGKVYTASTLVATK